MPEARSPAGHRSPPGGGIDPCFANTHAAIAAAIFWLRRAITGIFDAASGWQTLNRRAAPSANAHPERASSSKKRRIRAYHRRMGCARLALLVECNDARVQRASVTEDSAI
jgi:hypothetical protein